VTNYTYSAPTAFLGESQEMQTAIVQRSLPVAFNPADSAKHTDSFNTATRSIDFMPRLGSLLLRMSLGETLESRMAALDPIRHDLRDKFDKSVHDRQVFNLAVVLAGLDFLGEALEVVFGDEFKPQVGMLTQAIHENSGRISAPVLNEAAKVLRDMSMISRTIASDSEFAIRETYEYIVGEGYIEIMLRETFVKYFSWCKRTGVNPLYTNADSFISAMSKSAALMDGVCFDSKLRTKGGGLSKIFRFDLDKLTSEQ
jgi:hypothetical protein